MFMHEVRGGCSGRKRGVMMLFYFNASLKELNFLDEGASIKLATCSSNLSLGCSFIAPRICHIHILLNYVKWSCQL
jgi:hypothetical protein